MADGSWLRGSWDVGVHLDTGQLSYPFTMVRGRVLPAVDTLAHMGQAVFNAVTWMGCTILHCSCLVPLG